MDINSETILDLKTIKRTYPFNFESAVDEMFAKNRNLKSGFWKGILKITKE